MARKTATLIGFGAVLLWSILAYLTVGAGNVPPFQLSAICFAIGGLVGVIWMLKTGAGVQKLAQVRWPVWVLGIGGLFGYHALYFTALQLAPAAEASLIAYLWPLLIVLFSGLLPGETLRKMHIVGAVIALSGAAIIVGGGAEFAAQNLLGYGAAFACAFIWAIYSVLSRLAGDAPTETVTVFCFGTAILATIAHVLFEQTVWPADISAWINTILLGLGPVGLAFYLWDVGVKRGNIQILGVAAYAAPLLSTIVMVAAGYAQSGWTIFIAAILIAGGALLSARA